MSTETNEIKRGAFGRPAKPKETATVKTKEAKSVKKGFYIFRLINEETLARPRDKKTNEPVGEPFPPLYFAPSSGVAINPESGDPERWKYLFGYNSIWEKDQQNPVPSNIRLNNVDGKNDLQFRHGRIKVMAHEVAKKQALMVQDIYDGIGDNQIEAKPFKYTLVDESKEETKIRDAADIAFDAESLARKATTEEMLSTAMAFGINVNGDDVDEDSIRTKFILKAKADPALFMKVYNDPRVRVKYLVTNAIADGSIVVNEGVLSYNGQALLSVRMDADIAEQVATLTIEKVEKAVQLYDTLKSLT